MPAESVFSCGNLLNLTGLDADDEKASEGIIHIYLNIKDKLGVFF
jgi:hypothetical protein